MNWGTRIAIGYAAFVVFIMTLVVMAFQQDFDLVADNYYEQEIAYQGRIDQIQNAINDGQEVAVVSADDAVSLAFSSAATDVKIHFFRPSDDTKDLLIEHASVDSQVNVPSSQFTTGKYLVKVEWKANGKTYFQENDLFLN